MPVYNLACRAALAPDVRRRVAQAITDTHCRVTGAPPQFVNTVFLDGWALPDGQDISALGGVRSGGNRTAAVIEQLRQALQEAIAQASGRTAAQVAVRLIGVPSAWVMEGGRVMPEPGAEAEWLDHNHGRAT